ncbi:glycosyltransferase family 2 protein [Streptococcus sp. SPS1]|uniref:glycosyltransferase family 2 protein n=1 Tax=Streptococcus sp. SPS1 TaxID=3018247 RepID=UPI00066B1083|nr:glycosyltransferase family 2 protein [Streptococcus sp. SPS1]MDN5026918.1 glycosyltransferase family 2 protein [Streptococcus sp. SPS1]
MDDLISVIVPIYNTEKYLRKCIESILSQSYKNIELLLINDGSPDSSAEICREYLDKDKRCYYFEKENGGLSDARNYGIERAKGEYITFVDSDDFFLEEAIEKLHATALLGESDLVVGGFCHFDSPNFYIFDRKRFGNLPITIVEKEFAVNQMDEMFEVPFLCYSTAWGKLYKSSLFKEIRYPLGKYAEDQFTTWKLYLASEKIAVCNHTIYAYRKNYEGLSLNFDLSHLDYIDALEERIEETRNIKGIDIEKTYKMYKYVLNRRVGELDYYGYEKEKVILQNKIDELKKNNII